MNMYEDRIDEITEGWDELLEGTEDFALWAEGDFDQELFRETMYKTWELFAERIDFDSPEETYSLPIGMAQIFGQIQSYSTKKQITMRDDGGDIELSALIARDLYYSIRDRDSFVRDIPVVSARHMIDGEILRLTYHLDTGELRIESGYSEDHPDFIFDTDTERATEIIPRTIEPIIVKDISRWWLDDSEEQ